MSAVLLAFLQSHWRWAVAGALTGLLLLTIGCVYLKGRSDGEISAANAAREQLVDQLNERGKIDGITEQMDNSDLCRALGRLWHNGQCS